MQHIELMLN